MQWLPQTMKSLIWLSTITTSKDRRGANKRSSSSESSRSELKKKSSNETDTEATLFQMKKRRLTKEIHNYQSGRGTRKFIL
jgi:hypothetical protein